MKTPDGTISDFTYDHDKITGPAQIKTKDGLVWTGDMLDGKREGQGLL